MSGHSKWAQIKRQKGAADIKKGAAFTKLANALTVAAREGGGDPVMNFKLRLAVERARAANMPKDNIERAIKRGTGELGGVTLESVAYEGFGPTNIPIIVEALTDNRNRTSQAIKILLTKHGGILAGPGSVQWMFERRGVIRISRPADYGDDIALQLIEMGVEDIQEDDEELILLVTPEKLASIKTKFESTGWNVISDEMTLWPKTPVVFPEGHDGDRLGELLSALEDNEDVQHVSTTAVL